MQKSGTTFGNIQEVCVEGPREETSTSKTTKNQRFGVASRGGLTARSYNKPGLSLAMLD
jgi:hypothetical protein